MKILHLTNGKEVKVDDSDFQMLSAYTWIESTKGYAKGYKPLGRVGNKRGIRRPKPKRVYMHSLIMGTTGQTLTPDHKDRNKLNNQRSNLRIATLSQQAANRRIPNKGIYLIKKSGRWRARLQSQVHGKRSLGCFATREEALTAYDNAAKDLWGEFAFLNKDYEFSDVLPLEVSR